MGNPLKAITGAVEAAAMRLARGGDRCERHGLRLHRGGICPACRWRAFSMRIYPVNLYVSRTTPNTTAAPMADTKANATNPLPGVEAIWRHNLQTSAKAAVVIDAMPASWGSLYRTLAVLSENDRGEVFMEFATGSRELKPGKRAPMRTDMPALSPEGMALFAKLFDRWDAEYVAPVLMTMSFGQPVQR